MRILHTADWHLGKRLERFGRLPEQEEVMSEIVQLAEEHQVDAVLIAGDLFDQYNPANDASELFYKTLQALTKHGQRPVIAIAGNHDSPERIQAPDPLARASGILLCGLPNTQMPSFSLPNGTKMSKSAPGFVEISMPGHDFPLRILLTPYANEFRLRTFLGLGDTEQELRQHLRDHWQELAAEYCDDKGVNVLMTHLFMIKRGGPVPEEPADEKPILHVGGAQPVFTEDIPAQIQYTALGHLHRHQQMGGAAGPAWYSSSPLAYSFAEVDQQKYINIIDLEPGKEAVVQGIPLKAGKRLLRYKADSIDSALKWLEENQEAWVELTLVTDDYLRAEDKARLTQTHSGIVSIIPELSKKAKEAEAENRARADLSKGMQELFTDYFKFRNEGQEPNEDIMDLLKEVLAQSGKEDEA